ncbi:MAG: hypothetical protein ACOYXC_21285 [Candidatus Rifleibacteriota bacterium]
MTIEKRIPCSQCGFIILESSCFCNFCGRENLARQGSIKRGWFWVKDAMGLVQNHPENLTELEKEVQAKIEANNQNLVVLKNQLRSIIGVSGLNDQLKSLRSCFLKSGGGSINELFEKKLDEGKSGFEELNRLIDPEFFLSGKGLSECLREIMAFLKLAQNALQKFSDYRSFQPRDQIEAQLAGTMKTIETIASDENRLKNYEQVFTTSLQAIKLLEQKQQEYALLRFALMIEFWKAEGVRLTYLAMTGRRQSDDFDKRLESLKGEGSRIVEQLGERFKTLAEAQDLEQRIKDQLLVLEEARLNYATSRALGVVEGVNALDGGYPETQKMLEKFYSREKSATLNFSAQIYETFEKYKEEEIRILAEKRIGDGTSRSVERGFRRKP